MTYARTTFAATPPARITRAATVALFACAVAAGVAGCGSRARVAIPLPAPFGADAPDLLGQGHGTPAPLSIMEEGALLTRAQAGDADAAFRLSIHFESTGARDKARQWRTTAARNGHAVAQYNEWYLRRHGRECATTREALSWLEKSAAGGYEKARRNLDGYRRNAGLCIEG